MEERTAVGGETALTLAVKAGLTQNVKSLLEHGASPHNTNNKNESPLLLGKSLVGVKKKVIVAESVGSE